VHDEAVTLLRDALGWELSRAGWAEVDQAVRKLASSLDVDKDLAFLELAAPTRIRTKVGDQPVTPVSEELRERVNELIHRLAAEPEQADGDA
jgi:hypothetical protein